MSSDTPRTDAAMDAVQISYRAISALPEMAKVSAVCRQLERELAAAKAEVERLRDAGVGYSQQTVDALSKERDELQRELAAMTDKCDSLTALYIECKRERDELQVLLQQTRHERDNAREALREMLTAVRSLKMPDGWPWYESQEAMLAKWEAHT
jgi:chromosome segregation ATPase